MAEPVPALASIWDLWLQADRREADSTERSLLFRDLLRANGYIVPGGKPRTPPALAELARTTLLTFDP